MKRIVLLLSTFTTVNSFGQDLNTALKNINSYDEAKAYVDKDTTLHLDILQVNSSIDTSKLEMQFYKKSKGDVFVIGNDTYKVIYDTASIFSRVNYIFLNGASLSMKQIDSTRNIILAEYKKGATFESLATKYNMDGNQNFGDTGWFGDGVMVKEFSDEVKKHKKPDVFIVDIPSYEWFYVVKKTFDSKQFKQMAILRIHKAR